MQDTVTYWYEIMSDLDYLGTLPDHCCLISLVCWQSNYFLREAFNKKVVYLKCLQTKCLDK